MPPVAPYTLLINDEDRASIVAAARALLDAALPPDLRDDRFSEAWEQAVIARAIPFWSCVAFQGSTPVGYLAGLVDDGILALEALYDPEIADQAELARSQLEALVGSLPGDDLGDVEAVEIWAKPAPDWFGPIVVDAGFSPYRGLHQMRRPLPIGEPAPVTSRSFRSSDTDALRLVNNRSFANHPSQGDQSATRWRETIDAPWFRNDGTRIYEDPEGTIAGFCITKIHHDPPLGEIYVIGLDPSVHGRGLGGPMTAAGLHWLADQGLTTAMLYVEADNAAAIRTYRRLGFEIVRSDQAWRLDLEPLSRVEIDTP